MQGASAFALVRAVFHRSLITGITLFWLVMTGLLLRVELFPERGDLLPVPIPYVAKLIFLHQQPSDLVLYLKKERLGNVHLVPQLAKDPDNPAHEIVELINCTGAVAVRVPGVPYKRATFRLNGELTRRHELRGFDCAITMHAPQQAPEDVMTIQFDGRPPRDEYHYFVRRGKLTLKENSGTIAALLDDPDLQVFPFDPRALIDQSIKSADGPGATSRMSLNAHRGTLHFNGEDLETYVVTVRLADALESTIHVSQLGQILAVKTFADYALYDEALTP